jgi:hypothetical protein
MYQTLSAVLTPTAVCNIIINPAGGFNPDSGLKKEFKIELHH